MKRIFFPLSEKEGACGVQAWQGGRRDTLAQLEAQIFASGGRPVHLQQVHGDKIAIIDQTSSLDTRIPGVDAAITTQKNLALIVRTADCLPILAYHPSGLVAAVHAGRKGTQAQILQTVLELLNSQYGIDSKLSLYLGPSIQGSCYQVNRETNEYFNLVAANIQQAKNVMPEIEITVAPECTHCLDQEYFSYRREGTGVGMNFAAVMLQ